MTQWEYVAGTLVVAVDKSPTEALAGWAVSCTKMGRERWELISYEQTFVQADAKGDAIEPYFYFAGLFKRPVQT